MIRRVAFVGDSHFNESSRFAECIAVHDWIADDIRKRNVDLLVHTGDLFDRKSTPAERNAVAAWLARCASHCPVLIVRGNHDALGDLSIFSRLRSEDGAGHEIVVEETAGIHVLAGVEVAAVAWPRKTELLARMPGAGLAESEQVAGDVLGDLMRGFALDFAMSEGPHVLAMHAMVRGAKTSTGQPLVGCDLEVGLETLSLVGADLVVLGHIHKAQEWHGVVAPVVYTGSPRRTSFGEVEAKGYVLAELGDGPVTWQRIETPARRMLLLSASYDSEGLSFEAPGQVQGSEIRLRYSVDSTHRDAARADAATLEQSLLDAGAWSVTTEEVVEAETRARAPEVATAVSTYEKLCALWKAKGFEPVKAHAERLHSKLLAIGG